MTPKVHYFNKEAIKSIHMIAICGTGMTALAGMFRESGYVVTGSDENVYPPMSTFLQDSGISVKLGYSEAHLEPTPDLVVIGNAMSRGNPEVEATLDRKLFYVSLPFALREFFIREKYSCVVAGTHGKTSTSSLLAWVLEHAGRDPGFFIGGIPENFGKGFKLGKGEAFVSEGDEYDTAFFDKGAKFFHYLPDLVILNNIEFDHADIFNSMGEIETAFSRLINLIPRNGHLVACWDDPVVRKLCEKAFSNVTTFGLTAGADWRAQGLLPSESGTQFDVYHGSTHFGNFKVPLFGEHMVKNALSVIISGTLLGLSVAEIQGGLTTFKNVRRRLQFMGEGKGIKIFDDFAHHPTEVAATLGGLRSRFPDQRLWAIFEPRTATSKRKIFEELYVDALANADQIVLTPLYRQDKVPAQERLSLEVVCEGLKKRGKPNWIMSADESMLTFLKAQLQPEDVVLFMSNGDFKQIPANLITELK